MRSKANQQIKEAFEKEFNKNRQMFELDTMQKPLVKLNNGRFTFNVCLN